MSRIAQGIFLAVLSVLSVRGLPDTLANGDEAKDLTPDLRNERVTNGRLVAKINGAGNFSKTRRRAQAAVNPTKTNKTEFTANEAARRHWAFQPILRVDPPKVQNVAWVKTPVDQFILAALEEKRIPPPPLIGREPLIRRVTFDLIGLPPSPSEIDDFVMDSSKDAYEKLIDRLLDSPHYGERWGRHWLDVARFAESDGFEHDAARPNAWRYRDYVIESFNADKPFDRFIKEQIAGDELYPEDRDAQIATAFNLMGPDMVDSSDQIQRRHNTLNDMTDTAGLVFLGLTLGCARCHDHKFEPILQKDYYSLQAFFTPAVFRNDLPVPTADERAKHEDALKKYNALTKDQRDEIAALESPYRVKLYDEKLAKLSPEAQAAHKTPAAERTTEQLNQIQETSALVEVTEKEITGAMSKEDRAKHKAMKDALVKFSKPPTLPLTLALQDSTKNSSKTFVLVRGDYNRPGDEARPGFPAILENSRNESSRPMKEISRRAELAEWIASPKNPLTARVIVNRIWQHHFGRGIVSTPSDFGVRGQPPTHPDLLNWLASEFIAHGWSIKQLHKLILRSAVYQQSSKASAEALALDPENKLYSRRDRLRLEGEVIRDSLLAISGKLDRRMGGPGVSPPIPEDVFKGAAGWTVSKDPRDFNRRSIYIFARRNLPFPFLEVFDAPDSNLSCPERPRSTSAPQSLTLLNAGEVMSASDALASRLVNAGDSEDARLSFITRSILGRRPTPKESMLAHDFLQHAPWSELCRALFNSNAFVYVD